MIRIEDFFNIIKKYDLEELNGHLLIKSPVTKAKLKDITRELFVSLGELKAENKNFKLQKIGNCQFKNCVSPQCHKFILKPTLINSMLSREDIIEIAEDMDLSRIEEIGPIAYLKEYNLTQPDILKVSEADFRTVYAYMKGEKC